MSKSFNLIKRLFFKAFIIMFLIGVFAISTSAATKTDEEMIQEELNNIVLPEEIIYDFPVVSISVYGSTIKWESSNPNAINVPENGGWAKVNRTNVDVNVTLTVTISRGAVSDYREFSVIVPKGSTVTNSYTIEYELNGGKNAANPSSYQVGSAVQLLNPTKGSVEFLGWYDNPEFAGNKITEIAAGTSGDIMLYAKWAAAQVSSIRIKTNPTKLVYNALENFDPTGIVVEAIYNDGITVEEVDVADLSFSKEELHGNDTNIVVSYKGYNANIGITVNKLQYDMSGVKFEDATKVYNGLTQTLQITGTLPEGLTAVYSDGAKNVTTGHDITVTFVNSNEVDFVTPEEMTAKLTITKADLNVVVNNLTLAVGSEITGFTSEISGFVGNDDEEVLKGELVYNCSATAQSPQGVYDIVVSGLSADNYNITYTKGILTLVIPSGYYDIVVNASDLSKVYNGQNQMFTATLQDNGSPVSGIVFTYTSNGAVFTGATNVGEYAVTVSYDHPTYGNGTKTVTFKITKAKYNMTNVSFENANYIYDGTEKALVIAGTLPTGVEVHYTTNVLTNVGSVEVVASFTGDNLNYEAISDLTATLTITAKSLETTMFDSINSQPHTGNEIKPVISGSYNNIALVLGTDYTVAYSDNVEIGNNAKVTVTGMNNFKGSVTLTFSIVISDLEKVEEAIDEVVEVFPTFTDTVVVETTNGTKVYWFSTSTALSFNEDGTTNMIQTSTDQEVLVYAMFINNNSVEYKDFTFIVPKASEEQPMTIADIIAAEDGDYEVTATVVAVNAQSFLIKDTTGAMLVYLGKNFAQDVQVGDKVKVAGATTVYGKAKQFGAGTTYEKVGTETVDHGTAKELSATDCDSYKTTTSIVPEYVKVVGTLAVSGNYYNVAIEGATIQGSLTYPIDAASIQALNGKQIEIYGYVTGTSGSDRYLNLIFTEVNEVQGETPTETFTVTFKDYDGSELSVQEVNKGASATAPQAPTREGYTFTGWDKGFTNVQSDLIVTAQYTENTVNPEPPVGDATNGIGYSLDFAELENKTTFANWSTAEKYQGMTAIGNPGQSYLGYAGFARSGDADSTIITKALTFDAYFQVTMEVKGNGTMDGSYFLVKALDKDGNVIATGVVLSDSASLSTVGDTKGILVANADSTVVFAFGEEQFATGKTFADVTNIAVNYVKTSGNMGWKSISITALGSTPEIPEVETFTVTFKDYDGSELSVQEVNKGASATAPQAPTREGYTFTGWDKGFTNVQSDLIVTAQYELNSTEPGELLFNDGDQVVIATVRSSGNYMIMSSDLGTASTKRYQAVDSGQTDPTSITTNEATQIWTIKVIGNQYYLMANNGQYVTWTSGNSGNLADEGKALNIVKNEEYYNITLVDDSTRKLQLNSTSTNNYFAFYTSAQSGNLVIIKLGESSN